VQPAVTAAHRTQQHCGSKLADPHPLGCRSARCWYNSTIKCSGHGCCTALGGPHNRQHNALCMCTTLHMHHHRLQSASKPPCLAAEKASASLSVTQSTSLAKKGLEHPTGSATYTAAVLGNIQTNPVADTTETPQKICHDYQNPSNTTVASTPTANTIMISERSCTAGTIVIRF